MVVNQAGSEVMANTRITEATLSCTSRSLVLLRSRRRRVLCRCLKGQGALGSRHRLRLRQLTVQGRGRALKMEGYARLSFDCGV